MRHIVKSADGVEFVVESDARSVAFDRQFAQQTPADELAAQGDFTRVSDWTDIELVPPSALISTTDSAQALPPTEVEALERASKRWGHAGFIVGDKS